MKTALITGASRGIGRAIALKLSRGGHNIIINYNKSKAEAELLRDEINGVTSAIAVRADVSSRGDVEEMFRIAKANFGHVDILVNNAGISSFGLLTDLADGEWERIIAVNLTGAYYCARAALPDMISRKNGCIINISSMWGQTGASCEAAYSAAKAGLIGFTKALAKEAGPGGVRVNCVAPGFIETGMNAALDAETRNGLIAETPLCRIGTPQDVAETVAFLASEKAAFITGQIFAVNGGLVI